MPSAWKGFSLNAWVKIPVRCLLFAAILACCGCVSRRTVQLDAKNPAVRVSPNGVLFGDTYVKPHEVPEILDDCGVPRDRVIHILLDANVRNLAEARYLIGCLGRAGYTRPILVTKRHAEAVNLGKKAKTSPAAGSSGSKKIRYKRSNE
jgi:hypothetical protein